MSRPTKLNDEILQQAKDYIDNYDSYGDAIPSAMGMAKVLKVNESTLYEWAKVDRLGFSKILETCKDRQRQVLINKGLKGDFNAAITKLVLGKHGYHDRVDSRQEITVKDYDRMSDEELERLQRSRQQELERQELH